MSLAVPLVALLAALALGVSTTSAYPTKDEEAYYYNRLHDLPDYKQDSRNLDAIGAKGDSWPASLVIKSDQDRVPEKGSGNRNDLGSGSHLDGLGGGHLVRDLDVEGGGNLLRDLDMLRNRAAFFSRNSRADYDRSGRSDFDFAQGTTLGGHKRGCCEGLGYGAGLFRGAGADKRNMDEIDRSSFNSFVKKNFDEIDRSGFGSFVKKNFDEIDRSGFGSFVKRSAAPAAPVAPAPEQPHN